MRFSNGIPTPKLFTGEYVTFQDLHHHTRCSCRQGIYNWYYRQSKPVRYGNKILMAGVSVLRVISVLVVQPWVHILVMRWSLLVLGGIQLLNFVRKPYISCIVIIFSIAMLHLTKYGSTNRLWLPERQTRARNNACMQEQ